MKGTWDSIHVFEVEEKGGSKADYRITSTIMLKIETNHTTTGLVNCSGSLTRQVTTLFLIKLICVARDKRRDGEQR
jgi:capping protein beta